jgi:hypothetical protein
MSVQDAYAPPRSVVRDVNGSVGGMSDGVIAALRKTRPWVLFMAILGFIGTALIAISSISMIVGGSMMGSATGMEAVGMPGMGFMIGMGVVYLLLGVVYFMASLYLLRYAGAIKSAVTSLNMGELERALEAQASFWKLVGILTIVSFVLMIVFFIVGAGSLSMLSAGM